MSKVIDFYAFGPGIHDFYRCVKCNGIFTHEQERIRIAQMTADSDVTRWIHCRSQKYSPTRPYLFEWLKPAVLKYTIKVVLARGLYPKVKPGGRLARAIERLVSNRLTR